MEELEILLKSTGTSRRTINDPFLENSLKFCNIFERKGVTLDDEEELCHEVMKEFPCNACQARFDNLLDYELHYHGSHHFVCADCKKRRPTARLLEIHVQETHDNFFKVLAEKQPMYQCFVAECDLKFEDPEKRRYHCRQIHAFPKQYRFDEFLEIKPEKKLKKINKKGYPKNNTAMDVEDQDTVVDMEKDVKIQRKKNSISFGKCSTETFTKNCTKKHLNLISSNPTGNVEKTFAPTTIFIPRQVQQKTFANKLTGNLQMKKNVLESNCLMELEDSLPCN